MNHETNHSLNFKRTFKQSFSSDAQNLSKVSKLEEDQYVDDFKHRFETETVTITNNQEIMRSPSSSLHSTSIQSGSYLHTEIIFSSLKSAESASSSSSSNCSRTFEPTMSSLPLRKKFRLSEELSYYRIAPTPTIGSQQKNCRSDYIDYCKKNPRSRRSSFTLISDRRVQNTNHSRPSNKIQQIQPSLELSIIQQKYDGLQSIMKGPLFVPELSADWTVEKSIELTEQFLPLFATQQVQQYQTLLHGNSNATGANAGTGKNKSAANTQNTLNKLNSLSNASSVQPMTQQQFQLLPLHKKINGQFLRLITFERIEAALPEMPEIKFSESIEKRILAKFSLFLKGDYRSLKYYDFDHKTMIEQKNNKPNNSSELSHSNSKDSFDLFALLEEQNKKEFEQNSQQSFKGFGIIEEAAGAMNKNPAEEDEENNDKQQQPKQKQQTLFNLSKYLMHLIIELLSSEHLAEIELLPGYRVQIEEIVKRIKLRGQRTEHSQTFYYNHSHYNCLFLLLNQKNLAIVLNSEELNRLHEFVFAVEDFSQAFAFAQVNVIKAIIGKIVLKQFEVIQAAMDAQVKEDEKNRYASCSNYITTKIMYFQRVLKGIQTLRNGNYLIRF